MSFLRKLTFLHLRQAQSFCSQGAKSNVVHNVSNKRNTVASKNLAIGIAKYTETLAKPNLSEKELADIRNGLLNLENVKPLIVDSVVLGICVDKKYINNGLSYYKYIEACHSKPSIVATMHYLRLLGQNQGNVSEADRERILTMYKNIKEQFPSFDSNTATACVESLCAIGEWQESIEIIRNYEACNSEFLTIAYSALINYLYTHGQAEHGYKYLEISYKVGVGPLAYVYSTYLEYCLKEQKTFDKNIEKIFNLWEKYDIKPNLEIVQEFIEACNKVGLSATLTHVTFSSSKCKKCGLKLAELSLSDQEFKTLSKVTTKKLLLDKCYQVTSPKELTYFVKFIENTGPYDIIIDGLNILINTKAKDYSRLDQLITYFQERKKKVLVIGRQHLLHLSPIKRLKDIVAFYFVKDTSKDDPFILYAAMASGNNCKVVTQDFMRKEKFSLDDHEMRVLFKRWQLSHQYMHIEDLMKPMITQRGRSVNYGVQKQDKYWHIPFHNLNTLQRTQYTEPHHWACFEMHT